MDTVKHLGNYTDTTNNDNIDCSHKNQHVLAMLISLLAIAIIKIYFRQQQSIYTHVVHWVYNPVF